MHSPRNAISGQFGPYSHRSRSSRSGQSCQCSHISHAVSDCHVAWVVSLLVSSGSQLPQQAVRLQSLCHICPYSAYRHVASAVVYVVTLFGSGLYTIAADCAARWVDVVAWQKLARRVGATSRTGGIGCTRITLFAKVQELVVAKCLWNSCCHQQTVRIAVCRTSVIRDPRWTFHGRHRRAWFALLCDDAAEFEAWLAVTA